VIRKIIIGVPKKDWGLSSKRFTADKSYIFTHAPSSLRRDWILYVAKDNNELNYYLPIEELLKNFITL